MQAYAIKAINNGRIEPNEGASSSLTGRGFRRATGSGGGAIRVARTGCDFGTAVNSTQGISASRGRAGAFNETSSAVESSGNGGGAESSDGSG